MGISCGTTKNQKNNEMKNKITKGGRIIKCNIEYKKQIFTFNYSSHSIIIEMKQSLKRQIIKTNDDNKTVKLYHNGKELKQDDYQLGSLVEGDQALMVMVCYTMNDGDENKLNEELINSLTPFCDIHNKNKAILICINCSLSFCDDCKLDHTHHHTINKNEVIYFEKKLIENNENISNGLNEIGVDMNSPDFYKSFKKDIHHIEIIEDIIENIKNQKLKIMNEFKLNFENTFPSILDYKDKLNFLIASISESKKEKILNNDKEFVKFYHNYLTIVKQNDNANNLLNLLKIKISNYNLLLEDFKLRTNEILKCLNEQFEYIKNYEKNEDDVYFVSDEIKHRSDFSSPIYMKEKFDKNRVNNIKLSNSIPECYNSNSSVNKYDTVKKVSLLNLMSSSKQVTANFAKIKNKKHNSIKSVKSRANSLLENFKNDSGVNINTSNKYSSGELNINIDNRTNITTLINIEISTKNVFIFDVISKTITKKEANMSYVLNLKKFEAYHSTLNYKNKFYISGGYLSSSKLWAEYHFESNQFHNLKSTPHGYSYNSLIGVGKNSIYAISGFNNKYADRYSIDEDTWTTLPQLSFTRIWPSCIILNHHYLCVFGGVMDENNSEIIFYEKLDINNPVSWELIELKYPEKQNIPYYFGIIPFSSKILFVGGKINKSQNSNKCYSLNISEGLVELDNLILPMDDVFDGKVFLTINEENNKYVQFSSIFPNRLYLYDIDKNLFEIFECK